MPVPLLGWPLHFSAPALLAPDHTLEEPPNQPEGRQSIADSSKVLLPAFSLGSELVEEGLFDLYSQGSVALNWLLGSMVKAQAQACVTVGRWWELQETWPSKRKLGQLGCTLDRAIGIPAPS